jgi:hypothetical protein
MKSWRKVKKEKWRRNGAAANGGGCLPEMA